MSKATIVIPNINGKGWLKDSIESIYAQTEQDFDLIVVDNGSTDESLAQARSHCTRPNFTLIENGRNTGFSYAVNQGIARAQSKYVVLFNNDAFAEPQWLAELLRTADADPKIFAVQSLMIRHFERELADDAGDYVTWMGFACKTGDGRRASRYTKQAATLRKSIDAFFAAQVEGFDTYRYYDGNDVLRSWICIPLCMGIYERAEGTIQALFSPRLWTENGLLSQAGTTIFWDRSTLYALRGVFMAGETEKAHRYLQSYSHTRLLGNHVPYAVEAWPEGGQRHLSAESALYARIFTEGVFGIRPTGLRSFTFSPRLPKPWNHMSLHDIKAFAHSFTIDVARKDESHLSVCVTTGGREVLKKTIKEGATVKCTLAQ